jgi:hypothetical protein
VSAFQIAAVPFCPQKGRLGRFVNRSAGESHFEFP